MSHGTARSDEGSAAAEFVLVGAVLTALTLAVIQLGFAVHVRNTALDAAAEGARHAALAGNGLEDGVVRTRDLISSAIGEEYAQHISAANEEHLGFAAVSVRVSMPLPVAGLLGPSRALEVVGHAPVETLDR